MNLTETQKTLLRILKKTDLSDRFYWTGGTLLSVYYLHHRYSYDLDLFNEQPFRYEDLLPFLNGVKREFSIPTVEEHKIYDRWEFIIPVKEQTRIEFVYYNHEKKRLKPLQTYLGVSIDSFEDIAANKTMAYFDRTEPKDLFDLYYLITKGSFSVQKLLSLVKKKFGASFSEFMFWSESTKSLKLLNSLQPFIPEKDEAKKKRLIQGISTYFLENGKNYLKAKLT